MNQPQLPSVYYQNEVDAGKRIYVRMQCSGTADANLSTVVYAMGG